VLLHFLIGAVTFLKVVSLHFLIGASPFSVRVLVHFLSQRFSTCFPWTTGGLQPSARLSASKA